MIVLTRNDMYGAWDYSIRNSSYVSSAILHPRVGRALTFTNT